MALKVPLSLPETESRPAGYTIDLARLRQRNGANQGERAVRRRGDTDTYDVDHVLTGQL